MQSQRGWFFYINKSDRDLRCRYLSSSMLTHTVGITINILGAKRGVIVGSHINPETSIDPALLVIYTYLLLIIFHCQKLVREWNPWLLNRKAVITCSFPTMDVVFVIYFPLHNQNSWKKERKEIFITHAMTQF